MPLIWLQRNSQEQKGSWKTAYQFVWGNCYCNQHPSLGSIPIDNMESISSHRSSCEKIMFGFFFYMSSMVTPFHGEIESTLTKNMKLEDSDIYGTDCNLLNFQ
jgi:hypothetical protein